MKIFISWSGPISKQIAKYLHEWLPMVLQYIEPYMSSQDNETGIRWFNNVSTELQSSNFGILCLTHENLTAPWIHFEAGAISKVIKNSRVAPLLFGLQPSDLPGPLTQFQAKAFDKEGIHDLLRSINNIAADEARDLTFVELMFAALWDKLDARIAALAEPGHDTIPEGASSQSQEFGSVLEEILALTRQQSILTSDGIRHIVYQLQQQTNELRKTLDFPDLENFYRYKEMLSSSWRKLKHALETYMGLPEISEIRKLHDKELSSFLATFIEVDRSIQGLRDLTPRSNVSITPPAPPANSPSIFKRPRPRLTRTDVEPDALGGSFEPPYHPSDYSADETSNKGS